MTERRRIFALIAILAAVAALLTGASTALLYGTAVEAERQRLLALVDSQATLVAALDHAHPDDGHGAGRLHMREIVQQAVQEASYRGFGATGELLVAMRSTRGTTEYLTPRRHPEPARPPRSSLADPMEQALGGGSGTMVSQDYRGTPVLAAYRGLPGLNVGIVAKVDMAEIRAPYLRAAILAALFALAAVCAGAMLVYLVTWPLVRRVRQSEAHNRAIVETAAEGFLTFDRHGRLVSANPAAESLLGEPEKRLHGRPVAGLLCVDGVDLTDMRALHQLAGERQAREGLALRPGGASTAVEVSLSHMPTEEGAGLLALIRDVSERLRAESELRYSRRLLQVVFDTIPQAVYVKDDRGRYITVNTAMAGLHGLPRDALEGHMPDEMPRVAEREQALFAEARAAGGGAGTPGAGVDVALELEDGGERRFNTRVLPLWGEEGRISGTVGVADDVTERKRAEEALRHSEARVRLLLDSTAEGIVGIDAAGRCMFANPAAARALGYDRPESLNGVDAATLLVEAGPPAGQGVATPLHRVIEAGERLHREEERLRRADGTRFPAEYWAHPIEEEGRPAGAVLTFVDISERKRAEAERNMLAAAVEQAADHVFVTDTEGRIQYVNAAFERGTGYSREEVQGQTPAILKGEDLDDAAYRGMWQTMLSGGVWRGTYRNLRKDGSPYEVEAANFGLKDAQGHLSHLISVQRDMTEHRELERQLRRAQRLEAIGTLSGGIAHDFNNLLTPIIGFAEMTRDRMGEDSKERADLQRVLNAAHRAQDLVGQILLFSRKSESSVKALNPRVITKEVLKLIRATLPKNVQIEEEIARDVAKVQADPAQLHQVLMNLCVNASQAMPEGGGLRVSLKNLAVENLLDYTGQLRSGRYVCISVADTGEGMSEEVLARIFEPFFTTREAGGGAGLGLSTVYGIVSQHDGFMAVHSQPGLGSRFDVYLPVTEGTRAEQGAGDNSQPPAGAGERVLLLDDEEGVLAFCERVLTSLGYSVQAFSEAEAAMAAFREAPGAFDLVVTDQMMPRITGDRVIEAVRELRADVPVILCSGYGPGNLSEDRLGRLAIAHYLLKPLSGRDLGHAVGQVLGKTPRDSGGTAAGD